MARGELRIYLGAAPGVGKTYTMLEEAHRRAERGTDVVVGFVETHGRKHTQAMLADLEIVPRSNVEYRGAEFTEMNLDAVLARKPEVAVIDEMAHTNVPGSRNAKRWQDIQELIAAGIDVLTTVNVQHLESLNDVVARITGVEQRETVPDAVVRAAEQVELVDMTPEALRRRMAHGNIYKPEKIDAALGNYFRTGNLTALRELALLWLADKVEDQLGKYRADHGINATWETRERVVVALTGGPEGDTLIRRAARIAARDRGADLMAVHVTRNDGLAGADPAALSRQRVLVESLGGTYHQVVGADVPRALLDFARAVNATQIVLGVSSRGKLAQLFAAGVGVTTTAMSGSIDVHLVTHERAAQGRRARRLPAALSRRRRVAGFVATVAGLPALTALLHVIPSLSLTNDILLFLAAVVGVSLIGGLWPALLAAVAGSLLLNYYFTPPTGGFTIAERDNLLALAIFVIVAIAVSWVVDTAARKTRQAAQAGADAQTLATVAGSVLRGERPLMALLERLRETFTLQAVTLLERGSVVATVGERPCTVTHDADVEVKVNDDLSMLLRGRPLEASDRRIVEAFAAQAAVALRQERLSAEAASARPLAEADRMRTALLAAVSHDLRTPLASAKAAVAGLRSSDVDFDDHDRGELLATADESLDRLDRLVANLLDMSRLQAGALGVTRIDAGVEDIVPRALDDIGPDGRKVAVHIPDDIPLVHADPGLLERILVNLIANALRYSPAEQPPVVTASALGDTVEVRIIDHGPGIPEDRRDDVFLPFQRLGDRDNHTGVGLGLALSRGLTEAMGGTLTPEDTPGGGLTMILALPAGGRNVTRILVVDDEPQIVRALRINLVARHYDVDTAPDGASALRAATHHHPDLVVLDLGLPDMEGTEVIRGLRGWTTIPIMVLSGRVGSHDKVDALDAGADDYITKPFGLDELLARIRAVTRRVQPPGETPAVVTIGPHSIDLAARSITGGEADVRLSPTEWQLLEHLLRHPGKLLSQRTLLHDVWGPQYLTETNYLRQYMARLRRKLEADPAHPRHLLTEPGMGYRFRL